jgi:hypothetical protein
MKLISTLSIPVVVIALVAALMPLPARASSKPSDKDAFGGLLSAARFEPIGRIKTTSPSGTVAVDGRLAQGDDAIWGGELISVMGSRRVEVEVDSIGEVTLDRHSAVRLATDSTHGVLVAKLAAGSVSINLAPGARAYVEAGASAFSASLGASFRVSLGATHPELATFAGEVRVQDPTPPQEVNIRIVDELGRPVSSGSQLSVRARSTRQIQVQVTDKNDNPLPDLPVLFSLGDPCLGSLGLGVAAGSTFRQKTDKRGIAAVPLVAGAARCAASIIAKVEGTNASVSIQTNVVQGRGFWSTQNTVLVIAAAAAAGIGIGFAVANSGSREPITPVPPPKVNP